MTDANCTNCKHAATDKRPKILGETGFGDQLMFDDADETVYHCKAPSGPHAGKEVGTTPVTCDAWAEGAKAGKERLAELDDRIARFEERMKDKS